MPPRRNHRIEEVYQREELAQLERRLQQNLDQRMEQMTEQLTQQMSRLFEESGHQGGRQNPQYQDLTDEERTEDDERPRHRNRTYDAEDDRRRWEAGMRTEIPEFHGSMNPEEFLDWMAAVEEILEFKGVPDDKCVSLIATRLRGRATAWWQQVKLTRARLGKEKIRTWKKNETL